MRRYFCRLAALIFLQTLSACQYVSYYKTNTTDAPAGLQSSPEVVCEEMGATRGTAALDWCVAEEEARRVRNANR